MLHARLIFERQWLHVALLAALLAGMWLVTRYHGVNTGQYWGVTTPFWLWFAIGIAITHQVYVWFCWRTQLHASWLTRMFGKLGFPLYAVGFSVLGIMRVAAVFMVALSNQGTLPGNATALQILALILLLPALYLFYSVKRYFGFRRAFGIDHFDNRYRPMPFERRGIFRFTSNGMYIYGFLLLWVPALWWTSLAALCVAAFNHLYIWVHYHATEVPDMKRIYGEMPKQV
ncbi:methyltransferase [Marinobacter sp. GN3S48]|uniref:methyltransferase n=1 Tax=Marinobacter sp. GN3S48 TaxID=3382302 RepID=UPI00387ACF54